LQLEDEGRGSIICDANKWKYTKPEKSWGRQEKR